MMRRFIHTMAALTVLMALALPAWAVVIREAPGSVHRVATLEVDPDDVGRTCTVFATVTNGESVHLNNELRIKGTAFQDVEGRANSTEVFTATLVLDAVEVAEVRLSDAAELPAIPAYPEGRAIFSADVVLTYGCPTETTTTTEAPPPPSIEVVDGCFEVTFTNTGQVAALVGHGAGEAQPDPVWLEPGDSDSFYSEPGSEWAVWLVIDEEPGYIILASGVFDECAPELTTTTVFNPDICHECPEPTTSTTEGGLIPPASTTTTEGTDTTTTTVGPVEPPTDSTLPFTGLPAELIGLTMAAMALLALGGGLAWAGYKQ